MSKNSDSNRSFTLLSQDISSLIPTYFSPPLTLEDIEVIWYFDPTGKELKKIFDVKKGGPMLSEYTNILFLPEDTIREKQIKFAKALELDYYPTAVDLYRKLQEIESSEKVKTRERLFTTKNLQDMMKLIIHKLSVKSGIDISQIEGKNSPFGILLEIVEKDPKTVHLFGYDPIIDAISRNNKDLTSFLINILIEEDYHEKWYAYAEATEGYLHIILSELIEKKWYDLVKRLTDVLPIQIYFADFLDRPDLVLEEILVVEFRQVNKESIFENEDYRENIYHMIKDHNPKKALAIFEKAGVDPDFIQEWAERLLIER